MTPPPEHRAVLQVRAHPRASRDGVGPMLGSELHVRVTRPASDGAANEAVRRAVAAALEVPPTSVRLVRGERSRHKRLVIDGMTAEELAGRLARLEAD